MDQGVSALQGGYLPLVVIDTDNVVSHLSKANSGYETNIARPDDGDLYLFWHSLMSTLSFWRVSFESKGISCILNDRKLKRRLLASARLNRREPVSG